MYRLIGLVSRETWVQYQVTSYQRFLKWYLRPTSLTLSNIRYVSRVKWSNLGKGVAPFPTRRCSSNEKGSLLRLRSPTYFLYVFLKAIYILEFLQRVCNLSRWENLLNLFIQSTMNIIQVLLYRLFTVMLRAILYKENIEKNIQLADKVQKDSVFYCWRKVIFDMKMNCDVLLFYLISFSDFMVPFLFLLCISLFALFFI